MGILTYSPLGGGWRSGRWSADSSPPSPARRRLAARFDMSLPENQRKLEAVAKLARVADGAGLSVIELAIAFVVSHPAVTSAIVGPRTMERSTRSFAPASTSTWPTRATASRCFSALCGAASRKDEMQITRSSIDTQKGPGDWFTGDVYIDAVAAPAGTSTFAAASV